MLRPVDERMTISSWRSPSATFLCLPMCPSTNARTQPVRMGRKCRAILTEEARSYIEVVGLQLKYWCRRERFVPIAYYRPVEMWFVTSRSNVDAHNHLKILCDALEQGGVVVNDKYILPRVMGVFSEPKKPEIIIRL